MTDTTASKDLRPGQQLRHSLSGKVVTLDRRKKPSDPTYGLPYLPGWWVREGGGLADYVIDAELSNWTVLDEPAGRKGETP